LCTGPCAGFIAFNQNNPVVNGKPNNNDADLETYNSRNLIQYLE